MNLSFFIRCDSFNCARIFDQSLTNLNSRIKFPSNQTQQTFVPAVNASLMEVHCAHSMTLQR